MGCDTGNIWVSIFEASDLVVAGGLGGSFGED